MEDITPDPANSSNKKLTAEEYDVLARAMRADHKNKIDALNQAIAEAKAARSEFETSDPDAVETAEQVRAHVVELVPNAKTVINDLMLHAESEAVRAGLAKFVMAAGMQALKDNKDATGMDDLFNRLGAETKGKVKS